MIAGRVVCNAGSGNFTMNAQYDIVSLTGTSSAIVIDDNGALAVASDIGDSLHTFSFVELYAMTKVI